MVKDKEEDGGGEGKELGEEEKLVREWKIRMVGFKEGEILRKGVMKERKKEKGRKEGAYEKKTSERKVKGVVEEWKEKLKE